MGSPFPPGAVASRSTLGGCAPGTGAGASKCAPGGFDRHEEGSAATLREWKGARRWVGQCQKQSRLAEAPVHSSEEHRPAHRRSPGSPRSTPGERNCSHPILTKRCQADSRADRGRGLGRRPPPLVLGPVHPPETYHTTIAVPPVRMANSTRKHRKSRSSSRTEAGCMAGATWPASEGSPGSPCRVLRELPERVCRAP
jgi:hypothetical protein